jgi:hypothetical protein
MHELLQQIDQDYYRPVLVARADLGRIRRECSIRSDLERRRKISPGAAGSTDAS